MLFFFLSWSQGKHDAQTLFLVVIFFSSLKEIPKSFKVSWEMWSPKCSWVFPGVFAQWDMPRRSSSQEGSGSIQTRCLSHLSWLPSMWRISTQGSIWVIKLLTLSLNSLYPRPCFFGHDLEFMTISGHWNKDQLLWELSLFSSPWLAGIMAT